LDVNEIGAFCVLTPVDRVWADGLTDIGVAPNDIPAGLNLSNPTGDAMDFLSLEQT